MASDYVTSQPGEFYTPGERQPSRTPSTGSSIYPDYDDWNGEKQIRSVTSRTSNLSINQANAPVSGQDLSEPNGPLSTPEPLGPLDTTQTYNEGGIQAVRPSTPTLEEGADPTLLETPQASKYESLEAETPRASESVNEYDYPEYSYAYNTPPHPGPLDTATEPATEPATELATELATEPASGSETGSATGSANGSSTSLNTTLNAPLNAPMNTTLNAPLHGPITGSQYEIRREAQRVGPINFRRSMESDSASSASLHHDIRDSPPLLDVLPTPSTQETSEFSQSLQSETSTFSLDSAPYTAESLRGSSESIDLRRRPRPQTRQSYYDFGSLGNLAIPEPQLSSTGSILPRMKTIDLYRRNARKSNDAELEFQLAQYVMQTALAANSVNPVTNESVSSSTMSTSSASSPGSPSTSSPASASQKSVSPSPPSSNPSDPTQPESTGQQPNQAFKETAADQKIIRGMFKEAVQSLKFLAERGHADSQYLLGDLYASNALKKPDMERSFRYFLMAAKHGHAESAYRTALCLQEGWGTPRGASRALQFYKTAAFKNQPGALYQMGMLYFHGGMGIDDNVPNRLQGAKWLSRAAKVANSVYNRAPHELAKIYEVGYKDLIFPDEAYAANLYAKSAELGHVPSALRLGHAYEFGELGCPQDAALSIHYYTQAALGNDPNAQLSLCAWYMVGAGPSFPVNHAEAYEWALRAALNGLPKGQFTTGFFYEQGIGVTQDIVEATKWYKRAADSGYEKAVDKLRGLGALNGETKKQKCVIM